MLGLRVSLPLPRFDSPEGIKIPQVRGNIQEKKKKELNDPNFLNIKIFITNLSLGDGIIGDICNIFS